MSQTRGKIAYLREHTFSFLLASIIIFLLAPPFFEGTDWGGLLTHLALTLVLITCFWVIFGVKKHPAQPVIGGIILIGLNWVAFFDMAGNPGTIVRLMAFFGFWTFTVYHILKSINAQKMVSPEVISGAISGYLLFGLLGGLIAACLELLAPGSFNIRNPNELDEFLYYSFVTLSTLGYGDIVPKTNIAQTLSIAISLTGQMYLTVVIAILVGKFISQSD